MTKHYAIKDMHGNWLTGAGDASAGSWHYDINEAWLMDTLQESVPWVLLFENATLHLMNRQVKITELNEVR